ncbi:MAG: hypothetical protein J1E95_10760 [Muribaculaceae bacterium]|nr:hypothetical protein [Muribaculaceae bacterium]
MKKFYSTNLKRMGGMLLLLGLGIAGSTTISADTLSPGTITPANGSTVTELKTISLTNWGTATAMAPTAEAMSGDVTGTLTDGSGTSTPLQFDKEIKMSLRPISWSIQLGDLATAPGEYTITVPEGFVNFTVDGENVPNAAISLKYTVEEEKPVELVTIEENDPITLVGSQSLSYQGVFTPSKTGVLTISYDPAATVLSGRPVLFESDKEMAVQYTYNDEGTEYYYDVEAGEDYYYLMGDFNPFGKNNTLYKAGTYTVTFSVAEGSSNPGGDDGGDTGDDDDDDDEAAPIEKYTFNGSEGTYNAITGGTVVMDWDIYSDLQEEGMQPEDNTFKAVLMGNNGQVSCTALPDAPTSLPGIPLGFDFPYAGNTFSHILISTSGYVMLGGETISGILTGGLIMDGHMGKFVFQRDVYNVLGCVDQQSPTCFDDTEISYLASDGTMTVQYKNWGFNKTMATNGAPIDMQIILKSDGTIEIVFNNCDSLAAAEGDYSGNQGPVYVALKGATSTLMTLSDESDSDSIMNASWVSADAQPANSYLTSSVPDGYTLSFSPSNATVGVEGLEVETADEEVVFYNLGGVKVNNPSKGIYLMKKGNKVSKVVVK